jgi:hypothetical protein
VVFGEKTVLRLVAVLKGLIPAATVVLLLNGIISGGASIGGSTLSFMGLALGALVGIPAGHWLAARARQAADRRLPLVLSLIFLPVAMLPAQPEIIDVSRFSFLGWLPLLGVAAAFPLGVTSGCSWPLLALDPEMNRRSRLIWTGSGLGLGVLIAAGAALALSSFKGALLVNLFAAPLVWPALPPRGDRSLLARMILTLLVTLSAMFLLFV